MTRAALLTPALSREEVWNALIDSIDRVFADRVDNPVEQIRNLRNQWITNKNVLAKVESGELFSDVELDVFDKGTLIKQTNLLGMPIADSGGLTQEQFSRIHRHVSSFWYSKGKPDFIDFLSYCLNCEFGLEALWTKDYINFVPDGHPDVGTPVDKGGVWYKTTHVNVFYDRVALNVDIPTFIAFFYDVSNYVLVINAVISREKVPANYDLGTDPMTGVGMAMVRVNEQAHGNFDIGMVSWNSIYTGSTDSNANIRGSLLTYFSAEGLAWPGVRENAFLTTSNTLKDSGQQLWTALSDWGDFLSWGGTPNGVIRYTQPTIDLGGVVNCVISPMTVVTGGTAVVQVSSSTDNVSWSGWSTVLGDPVHARWLKIRWVVTGADPELINAHAEIYAA